MARNVGDGDDSLSGAAMVLFVPSLLEKVDVCLRRTVHTVVSHEVEPSSEQDQRTKLPSIDQYFVISENFGIVGVL